MSEAIVAKRYGEALFQLATEKGIEEKLISELRTVKEVFQKDEQVNDFLNHPRITNTDKLQLIDTSFASFDKNVVNTLKLLVQRHRIDNVAAIVDEFIHLQNEANGVAVATVYSTRALTDEEKTQLEASFKKRFNKKEISIVNEVDPSLLGGVKIRVGNTIYDGSLNNKLNRIKHNIVSESI